jgi:hypothetical protein
MRLVIWKNSRFFSFFRSDLRAQLRKGLDCGIKAAAGIKSAGVVHKELDCQSVCNQ